MLVVDRGIPTKEATESLNASSPYIKRYFNLVARCRGETYPWASFSAGLGTKG